LQECGPAKVDVPPVFHNSEIVREQEHMILPKKKPHIKMKRINSQSDCGEGEQDWIKTAQATNTNEEV